jgi:uncharacterized membrane protein
MNLTLSMLFLTHAVLVTVMTVVLAVMPRLTRPGLLFAVTVDPSFRESAEARATERAFRGSIVATGVFALAIVFTGWALSLPGLAPAGMLVVIAGMTASFLTARSRTLPFAARPSEIREAGLRRDTEDSAFPSALHAGPLAILAASALWVRSRWDTLPDRLPMHWDASGRVNRWANKSSGEIYVPLVIGAAVCLFLWMMGWLIGRARRISASGPGAVRERSFRNAVRAGVLAAEYLIAVTMAVMLVPMTGGPTWPLVLTPILSVGFAVGLILVLARVGQGGSRLAPAGPATPGDRTADRFWKWGMFYVNRDDPAFVIEKRFGIGYTMNFGHLGAWVLLAGGLLLPIAVIITALALHHR